MGVTHTWQGVKHREGWLEWFTSPNGLPPRDLTDTDTAGFNAAQLEKLNSPAGKRLYVPMEEKDEPPAPKTKRPRVTITDDGEADAPAAENGVTDGHE